MGSVGNKYILYNVIKQSINFSKNYAICYQFQPLNFITFCVSVDDIVDFLTISSESQSQ